MLGKFFGVAGDEPFCPYCRGTTYATWKETGNLLGITKGLVTIAIGLLVYVLVPGLGCFIAGIIILIDLHMGGKRKPVWKCLDCNQHSRENEIRGRR